MMGEMLHLTLACNLLISKVNDNQPLWQGTDNATEVNSLIAKARSSLQAHQDRQDFEDQLVGFEGKLKDINTVSPQDLKDMRLSLTNMLGRAHDLG